MALFQYKRPRQFEYKPRFYDPKKEQLEQLKAKYGENQGEDYSRKINFRKVFEQQKAEKIKSPISSSKIILYACIVVILIYVIIIVLEKF
ncbi:MAG: hypothetical protein IJ213_02595 [Bacteroidales bacterium]|nr:hypothetical protein [Bacteroidales bacterium]